MKGAFLDEDVAWCGEGGPWLSEDGSGGAPEGAIEAIARDRAVAALYEAHSPRLLRRFARGGAADEARDLVQETFFRLVRRGSGGLQSVQKSEAYISRIASNLLRDRAKTARRRAASLHEPLDEARLGGHDQQRLLEQRDLLNRLEQAMLRLKPRTRKNSWRTGWTASATRKSPSGPASASRGSRSR